MTDYSYMYVCVNVRIHVCTCTYLAYQVCSEHHHIQPLMEALRRSQVPNPLKNKNKKKRVVSTYRDTPLKSGQFLRFHFVYKSTSEIGTHLSNEDSF